MLSFTLPPEHFVAVPSSNSQAAEPSTGDRQGSACFSDICNLKPVVSDLFKVTLPDVPPPPEVRINTNPGLINRCLVHSVGSLLVAIHHF